MGMAEGVGVEAAGTHRPTVFISHASQDAAVAMAVVRALERAGLTCWIAPRDVVPGAHYAGEIVRAINECSLVVLVLSAQSVVSPHVGKELERATSKRRPIIALRMDEAVLPHDFEYFLSESQWIEAGAAGIESAAAKVVEAVRSHRMASAAGGPETPVTVHAATMAHRTRPRRGAVLALATVLAVAITAVATWKLGFDRPSTPATPPVASGTAARTSVAVMPFANLTGDPAKEYLGDGMSEELLNVLAKVPGLKVPSRTSSFAYKGRNTDLKQIASDLQVGTILEGSVRSAGETIRITAQLIDARTDTHLWSETYDRKFTDLFQLQDELAKAIVRALQVNLNGASPDAVAQAPPTRNVVAYDLYLQARALMNTGGRREFAEAMTLFKRALALDPTFAAALAELAVLRLNYVVLGYPLPHALRDAEREADQALKLNADLAVVQTVHGAIHSFRGEWLQADALYKAAISHDPGNVGIRGGYATAVLLSVGHLQRSLEQRRESYRLAPAVSYVLSMLAVDYSILGRDSDARRFSDLAVQLGMRADVVPIPQIYANAALRSGHPAEAADYIVGVLPAGLREAGGEAVVRAAYVALGDPGRRPAASDALQNLLRTVQSDALPVNTRKDMIALFTQLGSLDRAYALANQSLDLYAREGSVGTAWGVLWLPEMRPFRQDVRFQSFAARLKLFDYWKAFGPPDGCDLQEDRIVCH
ncbi:MAG: hypothetical protein RLZZ200_2537 [Pseudomonadota bacterium]|jgi:TolB-like protein